MLQLNVSGNTYAELKQKAFEALGITEPAQISLPFNGGLVHEITASEATNRNIEALQKAVDEEPTVQMAEAARPKQTRAPRALKTPPSPPVVETKIEAVPAVEENILGEEPVTSSAITHDDAKAILTDVIAKSGMDKAIALIKKYNVKQVPLLPKESLGLFYDDCQKALAE